MRTSNRQNLYGFIKNKVAALGEAQHQSNILRTNI